jgi:hypothetical protein
MTSDQSPAVSFTIALLVLLIIVSGYTISWPAH